MPANKPYTIKPEQMDVAQQKMPFKAINITGKLKHSHLLSLLVSVKPGFKKTPHYHPNDIVIYGISGSINIGFGTVFDKHAKNVVHVTPGKFLVIPAHAVHYEWSTEGFTALITTIDSMDTVYVNMP